MNSRDSILRVKSKLESEVGPSIHEMIMSNASDEEMSDEKSLATYVQGSDGNFHFYQKEILILLYSSLSLSRQSI